MNIDLNKAMKDCEGIEKVQERTNTGVVSWTFFNFWYYLYRDKNLILQLMKRISKSKVKNEMIHIKLSYNIK